MDLSILKNEKTPILTDFPYTLYLYVKNKCIKTLFKAQQMF